jgi:exonuclease III
MSYISVLWWNVHNLKNSEHAARVVANVKESDPDVFALGEVVAEAAYRLIAKEFPQHNFYMTFGKQSQEMLIGVRRTMQVFFSQRTEFQSGNEFFKRLGRLKRKLDNLSSGSSHFIACGDFNIQVMNYLRQKLISASDEFKNVQDELARAGLFFADSNYYSTWIDKSAQQTEARLDYVAVSQAIQLISQGANEKGTYSIRVRGWHNLPNGSPEISEFINSVSNHASLYFEVEVT